MDSYDYYFLKYIRNNWFGKWHYAQWFALIAIVTNYSKDIISNLITLNLFFFFGEKLPSIKNLKDSYTFKWMKIIKYFSIK